MKKSVKFLLALIIVVIIAVVIAMGTRMSNNNNNQGNNVSGDKSQTSISDENINEELENIVYIPLEQLSADYTVEQAVMDKCFVIDGEIYNEDVLDSFVSNITEKKNANLRVVEMTSVGNIVIIDLVYSGDVLICSEDYSRNDVSEILVNEYDLSEEYAFKTNVEELETGEEIIVYLLENVKNNSAESIHLFAYQKDEINETDYLPNKFDAVVKSIDQDLMLIEPLESTAERNVSSEIFITLEEGKLNGVTFEVGQSITVTYTGEITEIAEMYQIEMLLSVE